MEGEKLVCRQFDLEKTKERKLSTFSFLLQTWHTLIFKLEVVFMHNL